MKYIVFYQQWSKVRTATIIVQVCYFKYCGFKFLPLGEQFVNENTWKSQRLFYISLSYLTTFCIFKKHPKEWGTISSTSVLGNPIHWPPSPVPLFITSDHYSSESKMSQKNDVLDNTWQKTKTKPRSYKNTNILYPCTSVFEDYHLNVVTSIVVLLYFSRNVANGV